LLLGVICCTAALQAPSAAFAAPITFTFGGADDGLTSVTKTVDGVSVTFNNFSPTPTTTADGDGLCVAGVVGFCPPLSSFDFSFSAPVQLLSYQVGFVSFGANNQVLTFSQGSNTSVETNFVDEATVNFSTQFSVDANVIISAVRTTPPNESVGSLQLRQLTVNVVPGPLPLLGAAVAFGASRKLRARIRLAPPKFSTEA
jgi:hypothetical protein